MPEYQKIVDYEGRTLEIRELSPSQEFMLMVNIGPQAAIVYRAAEAARRAARVASIDGQPIPVPNNEKLMLAQLDRVGRAGQDAVAELEETEGTDIEAKRAAQKAAAKSLDGPLSS